MKKSSDNYIILGEFEKAEELKLHLINKYTVEDFDIKTVYADDFPAAKILEESEYLPIFSQKRILHVKNCEKITTADCEILKEYFKKPSSQISIILSGNTIKAPLKNFVDINTEKNLKVSGLFPQIFKLNREEDANKLMTLFREHLETNERDFTTIINAATIYLRNLIKKNRRIDGKILKKYKELSQLDFKLKTGQILPGQELEVFLFYLFS